MLVAVVWLQPGLLLVDHVHFQYNGLLFRVLALSPACHAQEKHLCGAMLYTVLICSKHLFIVIAPAYFPFLLFGFCVGAPSDIIKAATRPSFWQRLAQLGLLVLTIVAACFLPFVLSGALIEQIAARLFPVGRGLCHAYWAPNAWAIANIFDKVLGR